MSVHLTGPVWRLDLPAAAKLVLLKFADAASDEGLAWPSLERVARECNLGLSTVRAKVRKFRRDGVLVLRNDNRGGRRRRNDYDVCDHSPGVTGFYVLNIKQARAVYGEIDPRAPKSSRAGPNPPDDSPNPPDDSPNPPDDSPNPPAPSTLYIEEPSLEPSLEPSKEEGGVAARSAVVWAAFDRWNAFAAKHGLAGPVMRTPTRQRALGARLREIGFLPGWDALLERVAHSPGLLGDNERGWRVTFDWLVKPANMAKVLEGTYDRWGRGPAGGGAGRPARDRPAPGGVVAAVGAVVRSDRGGDG